MYRPPASSQAGGGGRGGVPQGYGFSSGGLHPLPVSVPVPIGALKHMQRRGVGGGMGTPPMLGLGRGESGSHIMTAWPLSR